MKRIFVFSLTLLIGISAIAQKLDMEKLKGMKPRAIGPAGMSGRITAIDAVVANPDIIYAGAASGGVWKTTSAGISWEPVFDKRLRLRLERYQFNKITRQLSGWALGKETRATA